MSKLLASPKATPHPEWCALHDDVPNVCLGNAIHLDFTTTGDRTPGLTAWASLALGYCPEEGTDVALEFPGRGAASMNLDNAEQLALALLSLVATGRRGGAQ